MAKLGSVIAFIEGVRQHCLKYPKDYNKMLHDGNGEILATWSFLSWWPKTTNFAMSREMT